MGYDLTVVEREGYTFLDLLSDVGGLESILISVFASVITFTNYSNFDSHLASELYTMKSTDRNGRSQFSKLLTSDISNIKEYFLDTLPEKLACCKRSRKQKAMQRA